ncbi:MAG TPA: patatin-like phospholipase family protein [Gemmatimonadaceae bacterium]|nr:patatin-like phospholipase family protein [Gemmatimonadaceae bacterium]
MRSARRRAFAALAAAAALAGCAHYPATPRLTRFDPDSGYRLASLTSPDEEQADSVFVILTFSGGGTRAAALAYGTLLELDAMRLPGTPRTLLDEVDVISSVSGGSFTAAYYGLRGVAGLRPDGARPSEFEREFLHWNGERGIGRRLFNPYNWYRLYSVGFSRIDLAAETYDSRVFHGATFASLIDRRTRPFIVLNATDMSAGVPFVFTQEQLDPICADLSQVRVARAVAASSAFPVLLTPVTVQNHAGGCGYVAPEWVRSALAARPGDATDPDQYRAARNIESYQRADRRKYIHLIDGGVGDNIGVRTPLRAIQATGGDWSLLRKRNDRRLRHVVMISVNARTSHPTPIDTSEYAPGIFTVLNTAIGAPLGNFSRESVLKARQLFAADVATQRVERTVHDLRRRVNPGDTLPPLRPAVTFTAVEIGFDAIPAADARHWFETLPTNYHLSPGKVGRIRDVARCLLRASPEFRQLMETLSREAGVAPEAPAADFRSRCFEQFGVSVPA